MKMNEEEREILELEDKLQALKEERAYIRRKTLMIPTAKKEELLFKIKNAEEYLRFIKEYPSILMVLMGALDELKDIKDSKNSDKSLPLTKYSFN